MKNFNCFRPHQHKSQNQQHQRGGKLERRLSLRDYKKGLSWSKYLVSHGTGAAIFDGKRGEEEWSADMSQLLIGSKFASGRYSRIYHGIYRQKEVAIKMMSHPIGNNGDSSVAAAGAAVDELERQFTSEVSLLLRLKHPNIIKFVAACKNPPVFCIITEYMPGGSLRKFLHKQEPHSVPLKLVLKLALHIARGMTYLHSQGILHRDLKSENILLGEDMSVKVADFGISCLESQSSITKGFMGTYRWMAPEMIKEKHHTRKVDVYSFGVVLWELLTALTPFEEMTPEQAAFAVAHKNARPPLPSDCPMAFKHLVSRCWASDPDKRPQFDEIVAVLESYLRSFVEDPSFFSSFNPLQEQPLHRCFPRISTQRKSASQEA